MWVVLLCMIVWFMVGSQCNGGAPDLGGIISDATFNEMLKHRNDSNCPARDFYTYIAFIKAAKSFPEFGTTGDVATRKREISAFLGQTSHETAGGSKGALDGPYAWGYCYKYKQEDNPMDYCSSTAQYPCAPGKKYYGRGPFQLSWSFNYGQCGRAIGLDLLNNPELVVNDAVTSFKTALWFWMTAQSPKPSCHDVITRRWTPSGDDVEAGRLVGYGTTTNIINGETECGVSQEPRSRDRIGFYKRYCDILNVGYGSNLDCDSQRPFGSSSSHNNDEHVICMLHPS